MSKRNKNGTFATVHGHSNDPTYISWRAMHRRCYELTNLRYHKYGALGVRVCKRWHRFVNFIADMGARPIGTTIGRLKDKGNYTPKNCAWQTRSEQEAEKKKTHCKRGHDLSNSYEHSGRRYCRQCRSDYWKEVTSKK